MKNLLEQNLKKLEQLKQTEKLKITNCLLLIHTTVLFLGCLSFVHVLLLFHGSKIILDGTNDSLGSGGIVLE